MTHVPVFHIYQLPHCGYWSSCGVEASWNEAVRDAATTAQSEVLGLTFTSMVAVVVVTAIGKWWRISEEARSLDPSKRLSFYEGNVGAGAVGRSHRRRDHQYRSLFFTFVLEQEERSGDALLEARSSRTTKRGSARLELG